MEPKNFKSNHSFNWNDKKKQNSVHKFSQMEDVYKSYDFLSHMDAISTMWWIES